MEPSRMTKELRPMDPFKLEFLKSYKATGNITPTPIHIQLNELKKKRFCNVVIFRLEKETNTN